ncbi:MAG: EAL and HDOD domain-containing protein [Acidimicrobiales bacterium]
METLARQVLVGRQPILDRELQVLGYELLFRGPGADPLQRGEEMTAQVLADSVSGVGFGSLVGEHLAFVNATRRFLTGEVALPLPPERTVLEVPSSIPLDDQIIEGCARLVDAGFTLACDGHSERYGQEALDELVALIKLDTLGKGLDELGPLVESLRRPGIDLVALRVESRQQLRQCAELGFDYYQGYLLSRPETVVTRGLSPRQTICLHLLSRLSDVEVPVDELMRLLRADVGLSYRVLRAASLGVDHGMRGEVGSVRDAMVVLGQRRLASLLTLMLLADEADTQGGGEQVVLALARSRMTELVAERRLAGAGAEGFTVGLLSCLELLLRTPLAVALAEFPVHDRVRAAVLTGDGPLGDVLDEVLDYELGGERLGRPGGSAPEVLEATYLDALAWAYRVSSLVPQLEPA